jgi:hypothetical protein
MQTMVLMKIQACWYVTLCRWESSYRRFEGMKCLHLQGQAALAAQRHTLLDLVYSGTSLFGKSEMAMHK